MKGHLPLISDGKSTRELIDEIFSREMLGSVLVGVSAGKIVEKLILLTFTTTFNVLIGWIVAFLVFVALFVYWDLMERTVKEMTEDQ